MKLFDDLLAKKKHMVTEFDEILFNTLIEKTIIYKKVAVYFNTVRLLKYNLAVYFRFVV